MPHQPIKLDSNAFNADGWQPDAKDDWQGNNAAFTCRACGRVLLVSGRLHGGRRKCECGKWEAVIKGGRKSKGSAQLIPVRK